jgi:hypothetical protein
MSFKSSTAVFSSLWFSTTRAVLLLAAASQRRAKHYNPALLIGPYLKRVGANDHLPPTNSHRRREPEDPFDCRALHYLSNCSLTFLSLKYPKL